MEQANSSLPESSAPVSGNHPRKSVVSVYLVVSLCIHLVTIAVVLLASTQRGYGPAVTYIDLDSVSGVIPPATPVIHAPAPRQEPVPAEPAEPLPEQPSATATAETSAAPAQPTVPELLASSLDRGMTSGYFSSFADGRNLRDEIREYYFMVLEKVNTRWWLKAGTLKETASHDGAVEFLVGRDGTLLDLRLLQSSGSREVDRAIIEVLKDTAPFPSLPAGYPLDTFRAPLKVAAPLHLFSFRNIRRR